VDRTDYVEKVRANEMNKFEQSLKASRMCIEASENETPVIEVLAAMLRAGIDRDVQIQALMNDYPQFTFRRVE